MHRWKLRHEDVAARKACGGNAGGSSAQRSSCWRLAAGCRCALPSKIDRHWHNLTPKIALAKSAIYRSKYLAYIQVLMLFCAWI